MNRVFAVSLEVFLTVQPVGFDFFNLYILIVIALIVCILTRCIASDLTRHCQLA